MPAILLLRIHRDDARDQRNQLILKVGGSFILACRLLPAADTELKDYSHSAFSLQLSRFRIPRSGSLGVGIQKQLLKALLDNYLGSLTTWDWTIRTVVDQ